MPKRPDVTTDEGTTMCSTGTLAGLGNYAGRNVMIQLVASGTTLTECANPAGNVAPGQDSQADYASEVVPVKVDRQGRATYSICTKEPDVTTQSAGCPNSKWTGRAKDVIFTPGSAYLLIDGKRIPLSF
ncbi:hypothetical protein FOA19_09895 [Rufibacter hautae]|uniref:Uncharacterized protein n=1 Tax=Rufibacter hautae TaxID=2595005 RepID=A0A5B6TEA2_9BACT|nr:hypothetical protein FOA19_09895 [Rufibacter hautae]